LAAVRALIAALTAAKASDDELSDLRISERILSQSAGSGEKFRYVVL